MILREMSKVVDQLIGKTDFTDPDSVGEMVTEALTHLESEVWPNTMEFAKGIRRRHNTINGLNWQTLEAQHDSPQQLFEKLGRYFGKGTKDIGKLRYEAFKFDLDSVRDFLQQSLLFKQLHSGAGGLELI